jgi:hypothetical protein
MSASPLIITNLNYMQARAVPYKGQLRSGAVRLKGLLKYLEFREDQDGSIPQQRGQVRWIDVGLGDNYRTIARQCEQLSSAQVTAWTWVISPDPSILQLIADPDQRRAVLQQITEGIVESYYESRGVAQPEYAYAVHEDQVPVPGESVPLPRLHSHIVLPGTVQGVTGREAFKNWPEHMATLHSLSEQQFEQMLDREIGPTWRERWAEIERRRHPEVKTWSELDAWFGVKPVASEPSGPDMGLTP